MLEWLTSLFRPTTPPIPGTGALPDTRSATQQQQDIHFGEIVASAAPVSWIAKTVKQLRTFPDFDQFTCDACVAFSMAKLLGIMRWLKDGIFVVFSAADIYDRRTTKAAGDGQGMNGTDPYAIAAQGVTLDVLAPSQGLTEAQINAVQISDVAREVSALFKTTNPQPIILPIGDIDSVASVIQETGKGVMVWFYFTAAEWSQLVPTIAEPNLQRDDALRHSVVAVDFLLYGGKKALYIEDSAHFGGITRRIITEDFFKARNFYAAYPMNFQPVQVVSAPPLKHTFTKPLAFIPWDSTANQPANLALHQAQQADVTALQTILQQMSYFPANVMPSGYYGALTAKSVLAWQLAKSVSTPTEIQDLQGRNFGPASMAEMNRELGV